MNKLSLQGQWKLKLDAEKTGIEKKYFEICDYNDVINLPGTVSEQKKSPLTDERASGYLTDPYKYLGWAWFEKEIDLSAIKSLNSGNSENTEKKLSESDENPVFKLCLERTRVSKVWINGIFLGECNSIIGKHIFTFRKNDYCKNNLAKITILISNVDYPTGGGHMTSPDTQTNWLGITGEISLCVENKIHLENTKIKTIVEKGKNPQLEIKTKLCNYDSSADSDVNFEINCKFFIDGLLSENRILKSGENTLLFQLPSTAKLWSDTNPNLYDLKILLDKEKSAAEYSYSIGFRTFAAVKTHFEINGKKIFLRGKHDGMIFPQTGYAPADVESWLKVMGTAKDYGINHYRFHTCCPPEAAFTAADKLGIYLSPELPFWGTIQAPGEEGFNQKEQDYLVSEGYKILDNFGNHPSFVMMSMGNELWGSEKRLDEFMENYHNYDDRHLYTGGSNNFQFWPRTTEHEDYFTGVRFAKDALIRGSYAQCDAPLGFVQTDEPNTNHDYDVFFGNKDESSVPGGNAAEIEIQYGTGVKKVKATGDSNQFLPNKPCISHEVGQYCMYPNFEENQRFTGVLKPYNFEIFKERLEKAGLGQKAADFFRDSSRLAVQCYKTEIEALLRSNEISGFQLLDIQDFTGQGTAVVGVLNAFMESKGVVTGQQWRSFCDETVLLASFDRFVWKNNQELQAKIIFHNYSDQTFAGDFVTAYIVDCETDEILCEEQFDIPGKNVGNQELGIFKFSFENISEYKKLALLLIMNTGKELVNSYTLHVYPDVDDEIQKVLTDFKTKETVSYKNSILTKSKLDAEKAADEGKKVIYFPTDFEGQETVPGTYCTDFWCYPMFRSISESMKKQVPVGTLGLTIQNDSPVLKGFPTDTYTTPKWYNIVSHALCVNLKPSVSPIVQMIDNFERNWNLGILFEENGMLVCTSRLWEIADKPEVIYFLKSLCQK